MEKTFTNLRKEMTYHSSFEWAFEDGCTDELVEGLVSGLLTNRCYNKNDKFIECYGTCSA